MFCPDDDRDDLCDQFEERWEQNNEIRIEDFISSLTDGIHSPGDETLDELIFLEIDLRNAQGCELQQSEYEKRFPQRDGTVRRAFARINELDNTKIAQTLNGQQRITESSVHWTAAEDIPSQLGEFTILRCLGSGSFGVVYKAKKIETNEYFALKFPRQRAFGSFEEIAQLENETAVAQELVHPAIVRSYGVQFFDRFVFSVQQFVDGRALNQSSIKGDVEKIQVVARVADGLAFAHQKQVIHRDLKPGNIMMNKAGEPLIADFGLAIHESVQRRLRGQRCGSPAYMSPEQVRGLTHQMDGRSDIWSLGVVLYELLTDVRPFGGEDIDEIYEEITTRNEKPLKMVRNDLDDELQRICLKCLAKPIRERYNCSAELADDLRNWIKYQNQWQSKDFVPLVPRGLKSFGESDADAYLQLVPGHRDRFGVPDSIRFWQRKFESESGEAGNALCAIIGPSGSGKSSFVHAGLLPRLDQRRVKQIKIEATRAQTDENLLKLSSRVGTENRRQVDTRSGL